VAATPTTIDMKKADAVSLSHFGFGRIGSVRMDACYSKLIIISTLLTASFFHCIAASGETNESANNPNSETQTTELENTENLWFDNRNEALYRIIGALVCGPFFSVVGIWMLKRAYRKGTIEFELGERGRIIKWIFVRHQKPIRYWLTMSFYLLFTLAAIAAPIIVLFQAYKQWDHLS